MKTMLGILALCSLSACGGMQHWEKPNASSQDLQQTYRDCTSSLGAKPEEAALLMGTPAMNKCMNDKGFYLVN